MAHTLRIGFDGHAFASPAGGVRRYLTELVCALREISGGAQLVAIGAPPGLGLPQGVLNVPATPWLPTNLGWCAEGLPRAARRAALDVFHAPAYTAPLWGVRPLVVTIHDVSYERHPEWYPYRFDVARRQFYRRSALTADMVITDSEFSRGEIQAAYGIPEHRIRVIPLGVGVPFAVDAHQPREPPGRVPLVLHVGDLHERRNVGVLIDALALLRGRDDALKATELVLLGVDRGSAPGLAARADRLGLSSAVRFLPKADDAVVVKLLRQAGVFAYPSLYEGFGLPVLEAMACGTPVVASRAASIPEVVGDAGLLVDPHDVRAWYDGIASVLSEPPLAAELRRAGLARAACFTWQKTAVQTLEVYGAVLAAGRPSRTHRT